MHFWRTTVALVTAVATLAGSVFAATAGAVPRPSPQVAHSARRLLPAQAPTSEFFQGESAAEDPFDLHPGGFWVQNSCRPLWVLTLLTGSTDPELHFCGLVSPV